MICPMCGKRAIEMGLRQDGMGRVETRATCLACGAQWESEAEVLKCNEMLSALGVATPNEVLNTDAWWWDEEDYGFDPEDEPASYLDPEPGDIRGDYLDRLQPD